MYFFQGHVSVFNRLAELLQGSKLKPSDASQLHPLDPLTPDEVIVAAKTCKAYAEKDGVSPLRFNAITLQVYTYNLKVPESRKQACLPPRC